jgi:hypothetical protein
VKDGSLFRVDSQFLQLFNTVHLIEVANEVNKLTLLLGVNIMYSFAKIHKILDNKLSTFIFENLINGWLNMREPLQGKFMDLSKLKDLIRDTLEHVVVQEQYS